MQSAKEFLDSLDTDLNPEERAQKLEEFTLKQEEEYKKLQSASQKGVDLLADKILEEAKHIDKDPNYLQELYKKDPKTAKARVNKFWGEYTEADLESGKQLPPKQDDFDQKMSAYKRKEETDKLKWEFISAIGFSDDELKTFEEKLTALVGDRVLTKEWLKQAMVWVAFDMGKKFSANKESIIMDHNAIPTGSPKGGKSDEYKPHDPGTNEFLKNAGVLKEAPKK